MHKMQDALVRIEDGSFGQCQECGEEIAEARLKARPTATICLHCKEAQEGDEYHIPYQRRSHTLGREVIFSRAM